jgi:hypothetical protein
MESLEMPAHAAAVRHVNNTGAALPRRSRTRKGKARLLTLDVLDGRTAAYAAARRLVETLSTDLGGDDRLSEGERQLVTRAAMTGAIVADFEARWVAGEPVPLGDYLSAVNVQRRVLATLGLQRRARDVSPLPLRERWALEVEAKGITTADGNEPTSAVPEPAQAPCTDDAEAEVS